MNQNVKSIIAKLPKAEDRESGVISEIIPGKLYLSCCIGAMDSLRLEGRNITRIVNCTDDIACFFPDKFTYMKITLDDYYTAPIENYFDEVYNFIEGNSGGATLVHCRAGVSRSSALAIAYVGKRYRMKFLEAYEFVHNKRKFISPNRGFCCKLINYLK